MIRYLRYVRSIWIALVYLLSLTVSAQELPASADSFTKANKPTSNYGDDQRLKISSWNNRIGYLQFSQPAGGDSANLVLSIESVSKAGSIDVHVVQSAWSEQSISNANAPTISPTPIGSVSIGAGDVGGTVSVDVSAALQSWLAAPGTNFGLALVSSEGNSVSAFIHSRESGNAALLITNGAGGNEPPPGNGNSAPVANNDQFTISDTAGPVQLDVLANDTDPDLPGDTLIIASVGSTSSGGSVSNNATSLTYAAPAGFVGDDTFTYTVRDEGGATAVGQVRVTVGDSQSPPPPGGVTGSIIADSFTKSGYPTRNYGGKDVLRVSSWNSQTSYLRFDVASVQGVSVESAAVEIDVERVSNAGYVDVHAVLESWSEASISAANAPQIDPTPITSFYVDIRDGGDTVTVDITELAQLWAGSAGANYGLALVPSDRESLNVAFHSGESSRPPSMSVNGPGNDNDDPPPNDPPPASNSPPVAVDDRFTVADDAEDAFLDVLQNDTDPDLPGDSLTIVTVSATSDGGEVFIDSSGLRYTPSVGFRGTETFTYTIEDEQGERASAQVSVDVVAPTTGSVTLSWTPPTQNTDGSQLVDLVAYRFHYGRAANDLTNVIRVDNPGLSAYVIEDLAIGTWYFATTVINSQGVESDLSNIASTVVGAN